MMLSLKYAATHTLQFVLRNKGFFLLYAATFLLVLPFCCHDWEHSLYFQIKTVFSTSSRQDFEHQLDVNQQRAGKVKDILSAFTVSQKFNIQKESIKYLVTIVTASRNLRLGVGPKMVLVKPHYLTQLVVKLVQHLQEHPSMMNETQFLLCDIDVVNRNVELESLTAFAHLVQRFQIRNNFSLHPEMEWGKDPYEKEKQDYAFCLRKSLKLFNPQYILMVEDDALPNTNVFPMLKHITKYRFESIYKNGEYIPSSPTHSPTYIKLFHPGRLQGYFSMELDGIPELMGVALLFGSLFHMIIQGVHMVHGTDDPSQLQRLSTWILCCLYWFLVALVIGRPHLQELRRLSPHLYKLVPDQFCCTQAMLFPASGATKIAEHLDQTKCSHDYAKDAAIFDFQKESTAKALLLQPSLFDHIGIVSSLRQSFVNPSYLDLP